MIKRWEYDGLRRRRRRRRRRQTDDESGDQSSGCPSGLGKLYRNVCYCNTSTFRLLDACDVECQHFNKNRPPDDGGCRCVSPHAGPFCLQRVCHFTQSSKFADQHYKLYCLNETSSASADETVVECSTITNAFVPFRVNYPECQCINGGKRLGDDVENRTCVCQEGFDGDLCHNRAEKQSGQELSLLPVLTILSVLFLVLIIAYMIIYWRRRRRKEFYSKLMQASRHEALSVAAAAATATSPSQTSASTSSKTYVHGHQRGHRRSSTPPFVSRLKGRRTTLSALANVTKTGVGPVASNAFDVIDEQRSTSQTHDATSAAASSGQQHDQYTSGGGFGMGMGM